MKFFDIIKCIADLESKFQDLLIQMPTGLPTALAIPATAAAALLPDPSLSILQLLEFLLSSTSTINQLGAKLDSCPSTYFVISLMLLIFK